MPTLVLSSTSSARKMLLTRLQIPFQTIAPDIDETPHSHENAVELVLRLAQEKARVKAHEFSDALIIGCDQVAIINNEIVSKPENHENAVKQLKYVSGKMIEFYTGLCLYNTATKNIQTHTEKYIVKFRDLTDEMIHNYLEKDKPYHCAGSVRVEGLGIALLEKLTGDDPTALIGLPLIALTQMLKHENLSII